MEPCGHFREKSRGVHEPTLRGKNDDREKNMNQDMERISLDEAARRLHTTPLNILMHLKRGLLTGVEEEDLWMVDVASLSALQARTGGEKAPDVCASGCGKKHAGCSSCK